MKLLNNKSVLHKVITLGAAITILVGMLLFTNPENVALVVLLVPFLLFGCIVYTLGGLLVRRKRIASSNPAVRVLPVCLAFLSVSLLLLASLGQLTFRDGLLVCVFVSLFLLYISKVDFLKRE